MLPKRFSVGGIGFDNHRRSFLLRVVDDQVDLIGLKGISFRHEKGHARNLRLSLRSEDLQVLGHVLKHVGEVFFHFLCRVFLLQGADRSAATFVNMSRSIFSMVCCTSFWRSLSSRKIWSMSSRSFACFSLRTSNSSLGKRPFSTMPSSWSMWSDFRPPGA